ncbi:hypothetical protein COLO4_28235 [Corchorus olitorius]|uniref:F-box domain-containing protein n=1 Tax=Corchorus olitorius TaxID=93759 RepID=A0A1R3HM61_9ROSI|nr:hypothetical protein COLO4_28235 [Corchorus olitorius]
MAKQAKNVGGIDMISNLPDDIRCRILSLLPTDVAVRTSVLSTRWRYLFASLSNFDIDFGFFKRRPIYADSLAKFMLIKRLYFQFSILRAWNISVSNL